jgi:hypothetical protein
MIKPKGGFVSDNSKPKIEIANYAFNINTGFYDNEADSKVFLTFNANDWKYWYSDWNSEPTNTRFLPAYNEETTQLDDTTVFNGYYYQIATVSSAGTLTEKLY